ncbi:MAG: glycosyltransferase, partial [Ardenticatenaceae bacterium]
PFGLPSRPFRRQGQGPKELLPALTGSDRLILWGGGLWNWLDPVTLVQAMPALLAEEPRARLLFPGTRHPNAVIPEMEQTRAAMAAAEQLGLRDKAIFFGEWVAYDAWPAYLDDADVAVSLHFDTLETRFSAVRSRILSYIWARLPMVVTEGDAASRLVASNRLGEVVRYGDVEQVSAALLRIMKRGKAYYNPRFQPLIEELAWHRVAQPLVAFCHAPRRAPDKAQGWRDVIGQAFSADPWARQRSIEHGQLALHGQILAEQQQQISQLEQTIRAYEKGRFITLMRRLDQMKKAIRRRRGG